MYEKDLYEKCVMICKLYKRIPLKEKSKKEEERTKDETREMELEKPKRGKSGMDSVSFLKIDVYCLRGKKR